MFIATFLVKKRSDMTYEAFRRHQVDVHIPLVRAIPGLRRYVVAFHPPSAEAPQAHDLAAHLHFDDAEAFDRAMKTPEAATAIADQPNILEQEATVVLTGDVLTYED